MQRGAPLCAGMRSTLLTTARDSGSNKNRLLGPVSPPPPLPFYPCAAFPTIWFLLSIEPRFHVPGLRFERSSGNSLAWKGAKAGGAQEGKGEKTRGRSRWGCAGSRGPGPENPALCSAPCGLLVASDLPGADGDETGAGPFG